VLVLLVVASALLVLGLLLPIVRFESPLDTNSKSVIEGIVAMLRGGEYAIGMLILAFSVVFPVGKLVVLFVIWAGRAEGEAAKVGWLGTLGKWSMLDVYVVAVFVGALQLGFLAEARSAVGLYVFTAAILCSMIATHAVERAKGYRSAIDLEGASRRRAVPERLLSCAAFGLFAIGLLLPLMEVEKWVFWSNDYSIVSSLGTMVHEGEYGLLALVCVFIVLVPLAHHAGMLLLRWARRLSEPALKAVLRIEEWSMFDVFALALAVVAIQASRSVGVTPRVGLWCLLASAALSIADHWLLRRALRPRKVKG
jgi:paraquat-inducible protein A